MRVAAALAALLLIPAAALPADDEPLAADVLIQAGHEGRPDCDREPASLCNNTGTPGEIAWTPIVADEATRILRAAGISVLRKPAHLPGVYAVQEAFFIHFDGSPNPCTSRASIGYPDAARSKQAGAAWKALYGKYWPYGFEPDNFTDTLHHYYGFHHVQVSDAAIVIEGGEISCEAQKAWLAKRLKWEGAMIAYFASQRLGKGNVPLPTAP